MTDPVFTLAEFEEIKQIAERLGHFHDRAVKADLYNWGDLQVSVSSLYDFIEDIPPSSISAQ